MGEFIVDADVMARTRFGTSQLTESLAGLMILRSADVRPWHRAWYEAHIDGFRARLADDTVGAALLASAFGASWTASAPSRRRAAARWMTSPRAPSICARPWRRCSANAART